MSLLIFSDVHGNKKRLMNIINRHQDVDTVINLGDLELPLSLIKHPHVISIKGNAYKDQGHDDYLFHYGDLTLFCTHGHRYRVHDSIQNLYYKALETASNIVLYGHTHIASIDEHEGKLFVNPGSINRSRNHETETYLILKKHDTSFIFSFYSAHHYALVYEYRYSM